MDSCVEGTAGLHARQKHPNEAGDIVPLGDFLGQVVQGVALLEEGKECPKTHS